MAKKCVVDPIVSQWQRNVWSVQVLVNGREMCGRSKYKSVAEKCVVGPSVSQWQRNMLSVQVLVSGRKMCGRCKC